MRMMVTVAALLAFLAVGRESGSAEVAAVHVPEKTQVGGRELLLNGAGVRKKFIVKVYVGALYLTARKNSPEAVTGWGGPKRMSMRFLHDEVEADAIVEAWRKGFEHNLPAGEVDAMRDEMEHFVTLFRTVRAGERYDLDYVPGQGTVVSLNGKTVGSVPGEAFYRALLMVWLGPRPADKALKKSLLGLD